MYMYRVFQFVAVVITAVIFLLPDTYAVVGNVDVVITDGQAPVTGCTFRITNMETGAVSESTTDEKGAAKTWVTDDGDYRVEVIQNGETILENDISLSGGPKSLCIDSGNSTIGLRDMPFLNGMRGGVNTGWGWPNSGSRMDSGPFVEGNVSVPICNIPRVGNLRGQARGSVSFNTLDNDDINQWRGIRVAGEPVEEGDPIDLFAVRTFSSTGQTYNGSVGLVLERPTSILGDGGGFFYVEAGCGVTRYDYNEEDRVISRRFPTQPQPRSSAERTAFSAFFRGGIKKRVYSDTLGRNIYPTAFAGCNFTRTDFPTGSGTFRAEPTCGVGIEIELFRSNGCP